MSPKEFKTNIISLTVRIFPMISRLLGNKENAEDAVQEIMMKLWDKRSQIKNHPNINGFVFLTAKNYCLDQLKKRKLNTNSNIVQIESLNKENGQSQLEFKELNCIILKILNELPEQQKEIMLLRDMDGLEFLEIAEITNLKVEHIRVILSRARKHVTKQLKLVYYYEK